MTSATLTQGSVQRGLLNLTIPMILGISSSLVAAVFETWLLGRIGTETLAAYSFTFPVVGALTSLSLGLSIGLSAVLARTVGAGDQTAITRLATDGVLLMAVVMTVVTVLGMLTIKPLFTLMGAQPQTLTLINAYMTIWYFGLLFLALPLIGANALRAAGDSRISGFLMVGGAALQMILDPILILGLMGVPELGIEGAAYAMVISRFFLCIATFYVLVNWKKIVVFKKPQVRQLLASWKAILNVGLPATATNLIGPVSTAIIVSMLASYGTQAVAGFGIASRIEALSVIPLFALSASIGPFVGQNWGANKVDRANQAMMYTFGWSLLWGLFVALLFFLFKEPLVLFFEDDKDVAAYAALYLLIVPFSYGTWGVLMMASATFNALGKPLVSTSMSIIRMFFLYVPLAFIGEHFWGIAGIFGAACASNILMGIVGFTLNRRAYGRNGSQIHS